MATPHARVASLEHLIEHIHGVRPTDLRVERRPLRGGLEATSIEQLTARFRDPHGRSRMLRVVVKALHGSTAREAAIYERVLAPAGGDLSPRLLALDQQAEDAAVLWLEAVRAERVWPWGEHEVTLRVLRRIARLHARSRDPEAGALGAWDFEAELQRHAALTLDVMERARGRADLWSLGGALTWTRRMVRALPSIRQHLLANAPLGRCLIHGDLHPGNVILRRRDREPVLIDWGRARIGSPLEDVSCWLHSLRTWEAETRRRHDTLLCGYLGARGLEPRLDPCIRAAYWLAGASNALSGALMHHLLVLLDDTRPRGERIRAAHPAREWARVLRRADAFWS